jgi:predicted transcriptional regulator
MKATGQVALDRSGFTYYRVTQGGNPMGETVTVRLPTKLKKELERVARDEKDSKSNIIRDAVEKYLAVRRFRALRAGVLPFAEAQGILTDEDVFKALS